MSNYTVEDTSPLWRWHPYGDGSVKGGWASYYTVSGFNNQAGKASDGDSLHLTSFEGASVNFTFAGSSIVMFGTTNCSYEVAIDNATPATISAPPSPSTLYNLSSLSNGTHTISLTAHPRAGNGTRQVLGVDKAIITVPFDANATEPTVVDNSNTSLISYQPPEEWSVPKIDSQIPSMNDPKPYHLTRTAHAFASLNWTGGDAVAVHGVSNYGYWTYKVTLDGVTTSYNASSWWIVPDALLFFQPFSSPSNTSTPHSFLITNAADDMIVALNSITLYGNVSQLAANSTSTSNTTASLTPKTGTSHVNVGIIIGPTLAVLFILALLAFLVVRRHMQGRHALSESAIDAITPFDHGQRQCTSQVSEAGNDSANTLIISRPREQSSTGSRLTFTRGLTNIDHASADSSSPSSFRSPSPPLSGGRRGGRSKRGATLASRPQVRSRGDGRSTQPVDVDRIMDMIAQRIDFPSSARRGDDEMPPSYGGEQ